jgi:hypothetical protein
MESKVTITNQSRAEIETLLNSHMNMTKQIASEKNVKNAHAMYQEALTVEEKIEQELTKIENILSYAMENYEKPLLIEKKDGTRSEYINLERLEKYFGHTQSKGHNINLMIEIAQRMINYIIITEPKNLEIDHS